MRITIGNHAIGPDHPPFIIAEMSGNHNGSLERAKKIIESAAEAGAHAIKLQTYTPDTMTVKGALKIDDPGSLWHGRELHELYQEAYTPWEWHSALFEHAQKLQITIFSTPFDETAVEFLEDLDSPAYKIASFENTDTPLLKKVASTGKPIIISTGAASLADLDGSVRTLRDSGAKDLILLKCTSTYPASPTTSNLSTIPHMARLFDCQVGLSDHTMGIGTAIASIAFGATVVEKHFTLSRSDGGVDSAFSIEPEELRLLVVESERAYESIGQVTYGVLKEEKKSLLYKRSVFAVKDIQAQDPLTEDNIRVIRPGTGLAPKFYPMLLGKKLNKPVKAGTPISWEIIL